MTDCILCEKSVEPEDVELTLSITDDSSVSPVAYFCYDCTDALCDFGDETLALQCAPPKIRAALKKGLAKYLIDPEPEAIPNAPEPRPPAFLWLKEPDGTSKPIYPPGWRLPPNLKLPPKKK